MANKSCLYYEILGLNKDCSLPDIKRAYKQLARTWHPDKNPAGSEHIKLINKAYEVLSDPKARVQYDRSGFHTAKRDEVQTPVVTLRPYQAGWKVRVRVTSKTPVRTYVNSQGRGRLFSMELADESGEIRATAFREECDKFFWLEVGKVYYISRCLVKTAKFTSVKLKHEYELIFTADSRVRLAAEDGSVPRAKFDFVRLNELVKTPVGTLVDVIGVCECVCDVKVLNTGRHLKKIRLIDETAAVSVTLWDREAEEFDASTNPVVIVKGGRVTEYLGRKTVSVVFSSALHVNPDLPEGREMRSWFNDFCKGGQTFSNISDEGDRALWTLRDVEERHRGDTEYMSVLATVLLIRENCMYKACPTENCWKKVNDHINDGHYCVKCKRAFNSYKWRFLLSVKVADWTGSRWVSVFHDEAVDLLGVAPERVAPEGDLNRVLAKVAFREFIFRLRIKTEMYKGEVRQGLSVVSVKTPDVKKHCRKLIQEIKLMLEF